MQKEEDAEMRENRTRTRPPQDDGALSLKVMIWGYRAALLAIMMAGVNLPGLLHGLVLSKSGLFMLGIYLCLLIYLQKVYHACEVGRVRVSELVMSQLLADVISAAAIYACIALNERRLPDVLGMAAVIAAQAAFGVIWSIGANCYYFRLCRRPITAVIYENDFELELLYQSPYFEQKYQVVKLIRQPEADTAALKEQLQGCEVPAAPL